MVERFFQRVQTRDPAVEIDLKEVLMLDNEKNTIAQIANDESQFRNVFAEETRPIREYMVDESVQ